MHAIAIAVLVGEDPPPAPRLLLRLLLNWYAVRLEFSERRFNIITRPIATLSHRPCATAEMSLGGVRVQRPESYGASSFRTRRNLELLSLAWHRSGPVPLLLQPQR